MQTVRKDSTTDTVDHRLVVNHAAVVITSAEAALYAPGGSELRPMSVVGVTHSAEKASLELPWSYDIASGYKVSWQLTVGSEVYKRDTFFRIVRRRFLSPVTRADVFALHPKVQGFFAGAEQEFDPYLEWAWSRIEIETERHRAEYPEHIFDPERFKIAHIAWALAEHYRSNYSSRQSDEFDKSVTYEEMGASLLKSALDRVAVDVDRDGLLEESEEEHAQRSAFRLTR
jgi:hypothetical protein